MPVINTDTICLEIAKKLQNHEQLIQVSRKKENYIPYIQAFPWDPKSLSHGYPALVIFFSEMDHCFPGEQWDLEAHRNISALIQTIEKEGINNGSLFAGLTGVCFAVQAASKNGSRYSQLLSKLHRLLLDRIQNDFIQPLKTIIKESNLPLSSFAYDTIAGASGIIPYLLQHQNDEMIVSAKALLELIIMTTDDIEVEGKKVPGWFTPQQYLFREYHKQKYPNGYLDLGLAHGAAGCLIALSIAAQKGVIINRQVDAIEKIARWLKSSRQQVGSVLDVWPSRIGFSGQIDPFYRDGWCYGAPGIAYALFRASVALNDSFLREYAIDAFKEVCDRFSQRPNLDCPSFCHGLSGLLTILYEMYLNTGIELFLQTSKDLLGQITEKYDVSLPFGFKCYASTTNQDDFLINNFGLLDGSIGIALSLLFQRSQQHRYWTQLFYAS